MKIAFNRLREKPPNMLTSSLLIHNHQL